MAPIKTCVLGTGLSSLTFQVPFILALPELFTLHSVLERNPQTEGGRVKARFGVTCKIHRTVDEAINDGEAELVVVSTPNDSHYAYVKQALEAGKHVLVEKPVTATYTEAKELGDIAKLKNLVLYAYQNRRWDSDFIALKDLFHQSTSSPYHLGSVYELESNYDRFRPVLRGDWKEADIPGTGQTYNLGSHLIDQALHLFGTPDKLTAFISNMRGMGSPNVDDNFTIIFHYGRSSAHPRGLTVNMRAQILSVREPQLRFVVRGDRGTFTKFGLDVQEDQLKAMPSIRGIFEEGIYGVEPESIWGVVENLKGESGEVVKARWPSKHPGAYIELYKNLAGVIRNGEEQKVKWEEAAEVIRIIELAFLSSREGRTLVVTEH